VIAAQELEVLLTDLLAHHEQMLAHSRRHADALRRADLPALRRAIEDQQTLGRRIIDLESRRARLVAAALGPRAAQTPLSALAMRLPPGPRERVLALAERLKAVLQSVLEAQRVVARASESLMGHMQGLMQQVARKLSHAGTYDRPGRPALAISSGAVISGLDVRS
jgi:hypothetical protein